MPELRRYPPPPPPETFPANGYSDPAHEAAAIAFGITILIVIGGLLWAFGGVEKKRDAFMAKCIEFQTWDRCDTLYRYRRQDLMEQRR